MAFCGVCSKPSSEDCDVKCSGVCGYVFHLDCIKGEYEKKTRASKDFKCKECRATSSQSSTKSGSTELLTKDFLLKVMEGFKKEMFNKLNSEMKNVRSDVSELSSSLQFMSDKMDSSCKLMEQLTTQFAQLKKENEEIRRKNESLSNEVRELQDKVRNLEQYSRVNNVEISGIPVTKEENVIDLVKDIGTAIGVEVQASDISAAHRVPSFRKDRDQALIVQFTSRMKKEDWISKYRQKKSLSADQVNKRFPSQRVYINDHLSPGNKQLLSKLKLRCREIGYTFAWCRDAKLFARKAPGEPIKRINCLEDIEKLK